MVKLYIAYRSFGVARCDAIIESAAPSAKLAGSSTSRLRGTTPLGVTSAGRHIQKKEVHEASQRCT